MSIYYQDESVTLYHGDCREIADWLDADVLITDPPYGVPNGRLSKHEGGLAPVHADAGWDDLSIRDDALEMWGDRPRAVFGSPKMPHIAHRGVPVLWDKGDDPGMGDHTWPFGANYELIWVRGDGWKGKRRGSIIRAPRKTADAREIGHPTPKPLQLMDLLVSYAPPGVIADPFAGSGSTLISAARLGRKAIGVEVDRRYCDLIVSRLAQGAFDFGSAS